MGMFQVDVSVANPREPERFFEEKFWEPPRSSCSRYRPTLSRRR